MARVTKDPEVRRAELIDVALTLSKDIGFEQMSVESVTTAANVAKGTFYHYFSSKDDLRIQMAARYADELFEHLAAATQDISGTALERLKVFLKASTTYKMGQASLAGGVVGFLYRNENSTLRLQFFHSWSETTKTFLKPIAELATVDHSFLVEDVESTCDLLLTLWFEYSDRLWRRAIGGEQLPEIVFTGAKAMWQAQARILEVPVDTFEFDLDWSTGGSAIQAMNAAAQSLEDRNES